MNIPGHQVRFIMYFVAAIHVVSHIGWTMSWHMLYQRTEATHALVATMLGSLGIAGCIVLYVLLFAERGFHDDEMLMAHFLLLFSGQALHAPCLAIHAWSVAKEMRERKVGQTDRAHRTRRARRVQA